MSVVAAVCKGFHHQSLININRPNLFRRRLGGNLLLVRHLTDVASHNVHMRVLLHNGNGTSYSTDTACNKQHHRSFATTTSSTGTDGSILHRDQQQMPRPPQGRRRRVLEIRAIDSNYFQSSVLEDSTSSSSATAAASSHNKKQDSSTSVFQQRSHKGATVYSSEENSSDWKITPLERNSHPSSSSLSLIDRLKTSQQQVFDNSVAYLLPAQYPQSVGTGYNRYSLLCFSASTAGSAAMVLSTQTLLLAVGVVGQSSATSASVMAGALNWVLKDGIGQLGGVIFASKMGEVKKFDSDPKRWRMIAALSLDAAGFLEILSPLVWSSCVLPIACVANVGKNIGYMTASASRAAIHQSLAIQGNVADVTAKSASQSMAAGLIGTGAGIGLSVLLDYNTNNFIMGFCALSLIHQGCTYISVKAVSLRHLNRHRLHVLLSEYVETRVVLTPAQVADQERFFPLAVHHDDDAHEWLSVGSPLHEFCPGAVEDFDNLCTLFQTESYLLNIVEGGRIHLVFLVSSTGSDLIVGMHHAYLLRTEMRAMSNERTLPGRQELDERAVYFELLESSYARVTEQDLKVQSDLEGAGWETGTNVTTVEPRTAVRLSLQ